MTFKSLFTKSQQIVFLCLFEFWIMVADYNSQHNIDTLLSFRCIKKLTQLRVAFGHFKLILCYLVEGCRWWFGDSGGGAYYTVKKYISTNYAQLNQEFVKIHSFKTVDRTNCP